MEIDLSEYIGEYCAELFEQLDELQSLLLDLEQKPDDVAVINEIFRIAHTIKGSAATMGFDLIASVAHAFEDLLGEIREGHKTVTEPIAKIFFEAYDCIKIQANCINDDTEVPADLDVRGIECRLKAFSAEEPETKAPEETNIDVVDRLSGISAQTNSDRVHSDIDIKPPEPPAGGGLTSDGKAVYHIKMIFEADMDMKSVRAFLVLNHLRDQGDIVQILPSEKDIEDDLLNEVMEMIFATNTSEDEIRAILTFGEAKEIGVTRVSPDYRIEEQLSSSGAVSAQATTMPAGTAPQNQTPVETPGNTGTSPDPQAGVHEYSSEPPQEESNSEADQEEFLRKILGSGSSSFKMSGQDFSDKASQAAPAAAAVPSPTASPQAPAQTHSVQDSVQSGMPDSAGQSSAPPQQAAPSALRSAGSVSVPVNDDLRFTEGHEEDDSRLIDKLSEDQKNLIIESINQDLNVFELNVQFQNSGDHSMLRALTVANYMQDMSRIVISRPSRVELDSGYFSGTLQLIISTEKEISQLRELLLAEEIAKTAFWPISLEGLEIVSLEVAQPEKDVTSQNLPAASISKKDEKSSSERKAGIPTVRVTVDRLDSLMNLVGELVIKKTQLNQIYQEFEQSKDVEELQQGIHDLNQGLDRITSDLQSGIMKVRMVQIGQVFYRFARLVRDLSKNLGKSVEFLIEGAETELDKTVIDEIGDPLMHLIRNCLDHGIEPPEVRKRLGKSERGILLLRAQHAGNHIIVETADDGAGIDSERVKRKAIDKGFITTAEAAKMSQTELNGLIFLPGFSTSGEVTNVSGRGVGMDVVKETIDKLQGDIQIKSERNVGTTIQIKLPLTLAIIQGLLVRVCGERFTIPLSTVAETIQMANVKIHTINNQKVVTIRDEVIPLIYLQEFFELDPRPEDNKFFIVLAGDVDSKVGLVVNHLYGKQEIVIKSLDRRFASVKGFAGGTVLGDGTVSLILDIPTLIEESSRIYAGTSSRRKAGK